MKKILLTACFVQVIAATLVGQQTVGLFSHDVHANEGYVLFAPVYSDTTYLIDECGRVAFKWTSDYLPGAGVQLATNGDLIRGCAFQGGSVFSGGGSGGRIESLSPSNTVNWSFTYSDDQVRHYHDFELMPNGNVLVVAWELKTQAEAIQAGRTPAEVSGVGMWPEHIVEYSPGAGQIVWEWHAWDHLIQDEDPTKDNFGVVADHPELIDINYLTSSNADWQHFNSIDYNPTLDQILISCPNFNEIFIIDHSTTTLEASGHSGGNAGKGGDLLWRWGNPDTYGIAEENQLFFQHDAKWIKDGNPDSGKIMVYNNGQGRTPVPYSSIDIITPVVNAQGEYESGANGQFLPLSSYIAYVAPNPSDFFSPIISSANQLSSGNIFINEGNKGRFFEVDTEGTIVWEYVNPAVNDSILVQEEVVPGNSFLKFNGVFRARKLEEDYAGITALTLMDMGELELEPYPSTCVLGVDQPTLDAWNVYPNPASENINVFIENATEDMEVVVLDLQGRAVKPSYKIVDFIANTLIIPVADLNKGCYLVAIRSKDGESTMRVIIE